MTVDYVAVFLIGLVSSISHCYGMCGGFIMSYTLKAQDAGLVESGRWISLRNMLPHLLYNSGRILTYTFLGGLFGAFGAALKHAIIGAQSILFILAGIFIVFLGIDLAGWLKGISLTTLPGIRIFQRWVSYLLQHVNYQNLFVYGLILGFIPCGLVYFAGADAMASGSVLQGMTIMFLFGLGTLPALFVLGFGAQLMTTRFRKIMFKVVAILMLIFGLFTIWKGISKLSGSESMHQMEHHQMSYVCQF